MSTDIVVYSTIEALARKRDEALAMFVQAQEAIARCNAAAEEAAPMSGGNLAEIEMRFCGLGRYQPVGEIEVYRQALDRGCWESLCERIGVRAIMGRRQRDAMRASLKEKAPPFEIDNIRATLEVFVDNSAGVLRQTIVDIFEDLDAGFFRHDGFKIPSKVIHRNSVDWMPVGKRWSWWCGTGRDALIDLERIMRRFDGKPFAYTAMDAVNAAMLEGRSETTTEYFRLKWHKSGTLHIEMLRQDLVAAMNREIAVHFGQVIPMGTGKADPRRQGRRRCSN